MIMLIGDDQSNYDGEGYQLSSSRTLRAEWTKQGSAYAGELRIFNDDLFDEAMTMKLDRTRVSQR
jgi:hypothetical protein